MLSRNRTAAVIFYLMLLAFLMFSAYAMSKGSILILEKRDGTGFTMDFNEWSGKSKCELSLSGGDVLQVEIAREGGKIGLTVSGEKGGEPYTGSNLAAGLFTIAVSETDAYVIRVTGRGATGEVSVKNLGSTQQK